MTEAAVNPSEANSPGLKRSLGYWDVVALGVNGMIGAGIFLLPGIIAQDLGPAAIFAVLIAGGVALLNVLCFADIAKLYRKTGGPYLYARDFLGRFVGFEIGWLNWCSRMLSWAAIAHGFAIAISPYAGPGWQTQAHGAALVLLIAGLSFLNFRGVSFGARVSNFFTLAKLLPILIFSTTAMFFFSAERFSGIENVPVASLGDAVLVVFWAFLGFESVVVPAGEMRQPKKLMGPALMAIIAITTAVYLWITMMVFGSLDNVAGRQNPVLDASEVIMGSAGAQFISVGIVLSIFGMASAHALIIPRCLYALGQHNEMPRAVAYVHPIYRTPAVAIALSGGITLVLAFSGGFKELAVLSVLARFSQYLTTAISVVRQRERSGQRSLLTSLRIFAIPALAILSSVWVMSQAELLDWGKVLLAALLGLPFFFLARRRKNALSPETRLEQAN